MINSTDPKAINKKVNLLKKAGKKVCKSKKLAKAFIDAINRKAKFLGIKIKLVNFDDLPKSMKKHLMRNIVCPHCGMNYFDDIEAAEKLPRGTFCER